MSEKQQTLATVYIKVLNLKWVMHFSFSKKGTSLYGDRTRNLGLMSHTL